MRRTGFALVAALLSVVLLGALIVGAFVATTEETRISGNATMAARALSAAESALEIDLAGWTSAVADSVPVAGQTTHAVPIGGFAVTNTLVRLDSSLYWMVSDAADAGAATNGVAAVHRRIALLLRRVPDSSGKVTLLRVEERAWSELF